MLNLVADQLEEKIQVRPKISDKNLELLSRKIKLWTIHLMLENYPNNKRNASNDLTLAIKIKQKMEV
ncbi:MAG: hypothetical protein QNJ54_16875 [Prochloraceae cyanobacterium]|nr:hypothetical protein [Prochloraceae cyanobacterium]